MKSGNQAMEGVGRVLPLLFVLIGGALSQTPASGDFELRPPSCRELAPYNACRKRIAGRNSNYTFPQNIPGFTILSVSVEVVFAVLDALVPPPNPACMDAVIHITCVAANPPCDPSTHTVLPYCNDSCRAYKQLMSDDTCDDLNAYVRQIAETSVVSGFQEAVALYFNLDCDNTSTYLFGSYPDLVSQDKCTNIISPSLRVSEPNPSVTTVSELTTGALTAAANSTGVIAGSVTAAVGALLIMVGVALLTVGIFIKQKRMKQIMLTEEYELGEMSYQLSYKTLFADVLVSYELLEIGEGIGEGAFGKVYRGTLMQSADPETKKDVAIKTIKNLVSDDEVKAFFAESLLMKDFSHAHILGLLGVCFDTPDSSPYIVLPFMANGNMKDYLKSKRVHVGNVDTYPEGVGRQVLVQMCIDIAEGMEYLAEQRFVHRDLAARNCMVADDLSVKVGDFGLARDIYTSYYRVQRSTRLPVKWMPPETLHDGISNEKTDVWSFGVTCWEAFSLGRTPYPGIQNHEILDHITKGGRLQKPVLCEDKMYELITSCWLLNPEDRPSFRDLVVRLKDYWDNEHLYVVQSFSDHYVVQSFSDHYVVQSFSAN